MKLIFAVLDVSLTMGLTCCYKTEGFLTFIINICLLLIEEIAVVCTCSEVWNAKLSSGDDLQLCSRRATSRPATLHDDNNTDDDC